jgi:hypothetical protein
MSGCTYYEINAPLTITVRDRRNRDRMVVGFITAYAISVI